MDRHGSHGKPAAGKRPFLLLLSPDTLQLTTASDATDSAAKEGAPAGRLHLPSSKQDRPQKGSSLPMALLHRLTPRGSGHDGVAVSGDSSGSAAALPPLPPSGGTLTHAESGLLLEDGEPLEEGQLLTFSIALSQVVDLEHDERRIKVRDAVCGGPACPESAAGSAARPVLLPVPGPRSKAQPRCEPPHPCPSAAAAGDVWAAAPAPLHREHG